MYTLVWVWECAAIITYFICKYISYVDSVVERQCVRMSQWQVSKHISLFLLFFFKPENIPFLYHFYCPHVHSAYTICAAEIRIGSIIYNNSCRIKAITFIFLGCIDFYHTTTFNNYIFTIVYNKYNKTKKYYSSNTMFNRTALLFLKC